MARRIECECGFAVEGSDAETVDIAQRHALTVHQMNLTPALIRAVSRVLDVAPTGEAP